MSEKKFCAHRGLNSVAPENTLPAFAAAIALGAEEIEFDLWPTIDGKLIVCHDATVDRTTDGTGAICSLTEEAVRKCDAGIKFNKEFTGLKLPLFEEVLEQFAGKVIMNIHIKSLAAPRRENEIWAERGRLLSKVYIENTPVKMPYEEQEPIVVQELEDLECPPYDEAVFQSILDLIDKYNCRDTVYITGEKDVLETACKMAPDIERCCLEGHMNYSIVENAIKYKCKRVQITKLFLTREMIQKAHANNLICNLFWCDDPEEAKAFFEMGIDVILTNRYLFIY